MGDVFSHLIVSCCNQIRVNIIRIDTRGNSIGITTSSVRYTGTISRELSRDHRELHQRCVVGCMQFKVFMD